MQVQEQLLQQTAVVTMLGITIRLSKALTARRNVCNMRSIVRMETI